MVFVSLHAMCMVCMYCTRMHKVEKEAKQQKKNYTRFEIKIKHDLIK